MEFVKTYLPLLMYGVFFILTIILMLYNRLYQHEIQKSKIQIGITAPEKVTMVLRVSFYMGCGVLILLSIFTLQTLFSLFWR